MDFSAIYHRASDQMCYMLNENKVVVNIKTGMDIESVRIKYADPFLYPHIWGDTIEMKFDKELKDHKWWTVTISPKWKRLKYHFELEGNGERYFLFEEGFMTARHAELFGDNLTSFVMPWMNSADLNRTPDWACDTVWYQILPDRFFRSGKGSLDADLTPWREEGSVTIDERFDGNLKGITEKLDYLAELGISGIYLTPIFKATSAHHYDTEDYLAIDPFMGTDDDLTELVHKAHSLGIRVMLDAVFNHCGLAFAPWRDVVKNGKRSDYYDWFFINTLPVEEADRDSTDGRYFTFAFLQDMPKLNTNNESVISYFENVCKTWINKYDIYGIRIDAGNEVSHNFVKRLRKCLKTIRPDFYLLLESWHDSIDWLRGDEFDSVTNYGLMNFVSGFFLDRTFTRKDLIHGINECYTRYMNQTSRVLFNLLDSHDTNRLITRAGSFDVFLQQLTILLTLPGSPCIYYGTEVALEGSFDPDCRRCMPWKRLDSSEFRIKNELVKKLIKLRNTELSLRSLDYQFTCEYNEPRLLEYVRYDDKKNGIQVFLNCSDHDVVLEAASGEILFSHRVEQDILSPGGIMIRRYTPAKS